MKRASKKLNAKEPMNKPPLTSARAVNNALFCWKPVMWLTKPARCQ
jgi:hypothetical protein